MRCITDEGYVGLSIISGGGDVSLERRIESMNGPFTSTIEALEHRASIMTKSLKLFEDLFPRYWCYPCRS